MPPSERQDPSICDQERFQLSTGSVVGLDDFRGLLLLQCLSDGDYGAHTSLELPSLFLPSQTARWALMEGSNCCSWAPAEAAPPSSSGAGASGNLSKEHLSSYVIRGLPANPTIALKALHWHMRCIYFQHYPRSLLCQTPWFNYSFLLPFLPPQPAASPVKASSCLQSLIQFVPEAHLSPCLGAELAIPAMLQYPTQLPQLATTVHLGVALMWHLCSSGNVCSIMELFHNF